MGTVLADFSSTLEALKLGCIDHDVMASIERECEKHLVGLNKTPYEVHLSPTMNAALQKSFYLKQRFVVLSPTPETTPFISTLMLSFGSLTIVCDPNVKRITILSS